jgi:hypothetical protein
METSRCGEGSGRWTHHAAQLRHQPGREGEVAQMVYSELHLEAIRRGLPAGQRYHSRIVDQEIERLPDSHPLREVGDRCKAGQIEMLLAYFGADHFATDLLDCRLPPFDRRGRSG